jgi:hypothetical protein
MAKTATIPDTVDEDLVRIGDRFVSPVAAQLHIFGVLLGAHTGAMGYVADADIETLPTEARFGIRDLVENRVWWRDGAGYRIDPDLVVRTMRESLERLNDPQHCVATGSAHVRGEGLNCARCGAGPI